MNEELNIEMEWISFANYQNSFDTGSWSVRLISSPQKFICWNLTISSTVWTKGAFGRGVWSAVIKSRVG